MLGPSRRRADAVHGDRSRRRPHRLVAQDTALSRRRHGFESRWGHARLTKRPAPGRDALEGLPETRAHQRSAWFTVAGRIHLYRTGRATRPWSRGSATTPDLGLRGGEALVYGGSHHYRRAGGMLFRAKAVAFCSPHHGDTSTTVGGTRSCRAAWSARHPVKVEVAGSNPVRTAGIPGELSLGSQLGQVAQSV